MHRALDAGINFVDTANVYATGESETMLGRALGSRRARRRSSRRRCAAAWATRPNQVGLSRLHIIEAVEASLKRLGTDYIDLYQIHRADALTNIEDTLRALDDLVRAGKVRYIGCSNLPAWQLMKALGVSKEQRLERFRCTQSYYSLAGRELERETIPLLQDQGLGLLVWSPLAGGFLSGKFTRDGGDEAARRAKFDFPPINKDKRLRHRRRAGSTSRRRAARRFRRWRSPGSWPITPSRASSSARRRLSQLDDNLKAVDVTLSPEDKQALDEVSALTGRISGLDGRARVRSPAGRAAFLAREDAWRSSTSTRSSAKRG